MDPELVRIVELLLDDPHGINEEAYQGLWDYAVTYEMRDMQTELSKADAVDGRYKVQ